MKRCLLLCAWAMALCVPLGAEQVADLSRDGVTVLVDATPSTVDPARDFIVKLTVTSPAGVKAELPDLRDRFQGFQVAEDFAEEPVTDAEGVTTIVSSWRLVPEPLAKRYRLAPFVVAMTGAAASSPSQGGSFYTKPVLFTPPPPRDAVAGEMEIEPKRDLPPFSWRLVFVCAAALAGLAALLAIAYLVIRRIRQMVRIHRMSPLERAKYELDCLLKKDLPAKGLHKDFYVELTLVVRRYIERQHGVRAPNLTTEEFFDATRASDSFPKGTLDLLIDFLRRADMVKFAGVETSPSMIEGAIASARSYLSKDDEIVARRKQQSARSSSKRQAS